MRESSRRESIERAPAPAKAEQENKQRPVMTGTVAGTLRPSHQRILDAFIAYGAMTPDELAEKIARSVFYTRPRCSELRAMSRGCVHTHDGPAAPDRRGPPQRAERLESHSADDDVLTT